MSAVRVLPWVLHEAIEYIAGVFFVLAPFIFGFSEESAMPVFVGAGALILAVAVLSRGPAGIARILPTRVHAALDYVLAFFLLLAPFVFGFRDVGVALSISIFLGIAHLIITLVTKFPEDAEQTAAPAQNS